MYKLLDLYCGAGGASHGYALAGFEVTGVDIQDQPRYPYEFVKADALEYLESNYDQFDAIAASPPCQFYSKTRTLNENIYPDLIEKTRQILIKSDKPYVIENVPFSPLENPIKLCGAMFGLRTYRHRMFESNLELKVPAHPKHVAKNAKMGRKPKPDEFMFVVGNYIGADAAREAMQIDWMRRTELSEAIPPAYTEYIGKQIMEYLSGTKI